MTPLDGIRIADLSHVLAGPFATGQCALMGADVIRIEHPDGRDFIRNGGPPRLHEQGLGPAFLSQNAGKRSVALDLKTTEGRDTFLEIAATADIVVENFRPGVVDRLGIGYGAVLERRPNVIYASLSGFGPDGPLATRPAYDHIIQGISGMMAMTGTPESGPLRSGLPIVDYVAGQTLTAALLAALLQRAKEPDQPQRLHVSMLEAMTTLMGAAAIGHQATGALRRLEGNKAFSDSPYSGRFPAADGDLVITANTADQAARLRDAIGRGDLADADDATIADAMTTAFTSEPMSYWEEKLAAASVPCGPVLSLAQALAHPQMADSPCWPSLDVPETGDTFRVPGLGFRAPWAPSDLRPAPTLGRDTDDVLNELRTPG